MQTQNYIPLGNFLKREMKDSTDQCAVDSMAAQFAYLSHLHNNRLSIAELQRRIEKLEELKRRFNASIVDNHRAYRAQTERAVSKLCGVAA